jgi:hypothetical protein
MGARVRIVFRMKAAFLIAGLILGLCMAPRKRAMALIWMAALACASVAVARWPPVTLQAAVSFVSTALLVLLLYALLRVALTSEPARVGLMALVLPLGVFADDVLLTLLRSAEGGVAPSAAGPSHKRWAARVLFAMAALFAARGLWLIEYALLREGGFFR